MNQSQVSLFVSRFGPPSKFHTITQCGILEMEEGSSATEKSQIGRILRKKKRGSLLVVTVKTEDEEKSRSHTIPRTHVDPNKSFLFLEALVHLKYESPENEHPSFHLIKSAPTPEAVKRAMEGVLHQQYAPSVIECSSVEELRALQMEKQFQLSPRKLVDKLIRRLRNQEEKKQPKKRKAHTSRKHVELLNLLESKGKENAGNNGLESWKLLRPKQGTVPYSVVQKAPTSRLNLPLELEEDELRRRRYLTAKKEPQIRWMLHRLKRMNKVNKYSHVVDVGGGRGDLASRIALMFPELLVTVVDINESSLQAGKDFAEKELRLGQDRLAFRRDDFATFLKASPNKSAFEKKVDIVVALHACGDLSDLALQFAQENNCDFMLCPCCYTKRYNTKTIQPLWCQLIDKEDLSPMDASSSQETNATPSHIVGRLAETDTQPEISSKARTIINSMRIHGVANSYDTSLEAYSNLPSKRNLVLVGTIKQTGEEDESTEEPAEEDWSGIMASSLSDGFARHEKEVFRLSNGLSIQVSSAPSLTPMDMMDLSWGRNDATGNCIWTGARFFLDILSLAFGRYFMDRSILELGSGTGLAGIAIAKLFHVTELVLTDASNSALDLCRYNCTLNNVDTRVDVEELIWGSSLSRDNEESKGETISKIFDTVFATDVLYDIAAWEPLLMTAAMSLKAKGALLVSHIPRAALPEGCKAESLESYLIEVAMQHHFHLIRTHRPSDFSAALDDWESLEDRGAGIFEFQKKYPITGD